VDIGGPSDVRRCNATATAAVAPAAEAAGGISIAANHPLAPTIRRPEETMAEFDQMLRDILGDSVNRLSQFQSDQIRKVSEKIQEVAREGVRDEITRLSNEVLDLKNRVAVLEAERVRSAAEEV
jgi:hypothetical protein